MITKVTAKGVKGLDFSTVLEQHTLLLGNNWSGKSAHLQAIELALNGYVMGGPKKNPEILNYYGNGKEMTVELQLDNSITVGRRFKLNKNDSVSCDPLVNGMKASKDMFYQTLAEHGSPKVFDFKEFMSLSAQKKINDVFALFPPGADIGVIDNELTLKKMELSTNKQKIDTLDGTIKRLADARSNLELPAGNLAEAQAELEGIQTEIEQAEKDLQDARIKEAEEKAAAEAKAKAEREAEVKAKAEAEERARVEIERIKKAREAELAKIDCLYRGNDLGTMPDEEWFKLYDSMKTREKSAPAPAPAPVQQTFGPPEPKTVAQPTVQCPAPAPEPVNTSFENNGFVTSLTRILSALEKSGCATCPARIIVKQEIRRYQS